VSADGGIDQILEDLDIYVSSTILNNPSSMPQMKNLNSAYLNLGDYNENGMVNTNDRYNK